MPSTVERTTKEEPSKKVSKQIREKPPIRGCESVSTECTPRATQGAGETPIKPKPRQKKPGEKPAARPTPSPISDIVPKKNAQRAKGSISLNKTVEPAEPEPKLERRSPGHSVEKMKDEEGSMVKPPAPAKRKKKKIDEKAPATVPKKSPKSTKVLRPEKQPSREFLDEDVLEDVDPEVAETKANEHTHVINPAFNSCSFFERLQQGVRAYFTSRSSCNPEDRNKKEGGIRTRARVAKGVKEDAKTSKSGLFIKSISNSERDLFYELLRVNSSLGGQSSNFLSTKPKILRHFRKLKRKKLYHPKKHYVRIQIPRKGYFYRSAVRLRNPEPEPLRVLEPRGSKKKSAKVQLTEVASANTKSSRPPAKKRLRKKANTPDLPEEPNDFIPSDFIEELLYQIDVLYPHFKEKVQDYIAMQWPDATNQETLVDIADPEWNGRGWTSTVLENSVCFDSQKRKSETGNNWFGDEVPGRLDDPKSSWNTLLDCLGSIIGKEQLICRLQLTSPFSEEDSPRHNRLQTIHEEPLTVATILSTLDYPDSIDSDTVCTSPVSSSTLCESESTLNSSISASLMEGMDLHLELQNYLMAFDSCQNIKSRTKNTLQPNFHDNYIPLNIHSSSQNVQTRPEEFRDIREIKSGTSFDSATTHAPKLEKIPNEVLLDVKRGSELEPPAEHRPETEPQKERSSAVKRSISSTSMDSFRLEDETTWGCPFAPPSTSNTSAEDNYEKIHPFTPKSSRSSTEGKKTNSCIFMNSVQSLPGECPGQRIWKAISCKIGQQGSERSSSEMLNPKNPPEKQKWSPTLQELIDIYMGVLKRDQNIQSSSNICLSSVASLLSTRLKNKNLHHSKEQDEETPASVSLEEYVNMFQKILHSSLSISQIARLNNMIANLQDYSEKNYNNLMKELSEEEKKHRRVNPVNTVKESPKPTESNPAEQQKEPHEAVKATTPVRNQKPEKAHKKQHLAGKVEERKPISSTSRAHPKSKKREKLKKKLQQPPSEKAMEQIQLPVPTELESILKLGYASESFMFKDPDMVDAKNKLLVTVKLSGDQVLVSDLSYFTNEEALSTGRSHRKGTSELIIENVTNQQIWYKNTKSSWLRILRRATDEKPKKTIKKTKKIRKLKVKSEKIGGDHFKTINSRFEYDQMKLRTQHPIDAIAEISESNVSQQMDISDHDLKNSKSMSPPERKKLPRHQKTTKAVMTVEKKLHPREVNWKVGQALSHTKSLVSKPRTKRRVTLGKKKQATIIRSLVDLKKKLGSKRNINRKVLRRTYLCYPSMEPAKTKPVRGKSKEMRSVTKTVSPASPKPKPSRVKKTVKVCKNPTSEAEDKPKNSDSTSVAGQKAGPKAEPKTVTLNISEPVSTKPREKPSTNTVLYLNSDVVSDCSVEFLLSKNSEEPLAEPTAEQIISSPSGKEILKDELSPADSSDITIQNKVSVTHQESEMLNKSKQSPIAIFPPVSCSEVTNFPTEIIHSDSFLINFSALSVSQTKFRSLLKASSDLKFYPGRIIESGHEETPLVTFVLTPSQNETASLPENQVTVVSKKYVKSVLNSESQLGETTTDVDKESEGKDENDLKAIEKFINHMAKCRKVASRKNAKKSEVTKASAGVRSIPVSQSSPPTPRKMYHECQFRKLKELNKSNTSKNTKENKRRSTTPDAVNKIVISPSEALIDFQKEKKENGIKEGEEKGDGMKPPKARKDRAKYELKSVSPSDISYGLVEALKNAIANAEGISNKNEIISAIEEGFYKERSKLRSEEPSKSVGDFSTISKKLKMVKIKIVHTDQNHPEANPEENKQTPPAAREIQLLDSLVSEETEGDSLTRQNSTYFDALEKHEEEESFGGGGEHMVPVHTEQAAEDKFGETFYPTSEKLKDCYSGFTIMDDKLFASDVQQKESEEMTFSKISKSLEEGHVLYSMTLLESFLKKVEDSSDCVRLKKLLELVENKSKQLMMNMERNAWLKVLSLLEEVTQVFESQDIQNSKKEQLKTTKHIIDKIQSLNINRLSDLQKFCSSFSTSGQDDGARGTLLARIKDSLKHFKQKFLLKRINPCEDSTLWNLSVSETVFKVHSTVSLPEIREDYLKRRNQQEEKSQAQELKRKLQQQYLCILELMKAEKEKGEVIPPEIDGLKQKVAEKVKLLENKFDHQILEAESRETWKRATSLLKLAQNCRKEEAEGASGVEVSLDCSPGYMNLMKCLIKAWDTRMTINTIGNEYFG